MYTKNIYIHVCQKNICICTYICVYICICRYLSSTRHARRKRAAVARHTVRALIKNTSTYMYAKIDIYICVYIYVYIYVYEDIYLPLATRAASALLLRATLFASHPRIRSTYIYTHIYIYTYATRHARYRRAAVRNNHIYIYTHIYIHVPLATCAAVAQ